MVKASMPHNYFGRARGVDPLALFRAWKMYFNFVFSEDIREIREKHPNLPEEKLRFFVSVVRNIIMGASPSPNVKIYTFTKRRGWGAGRPAFAFTFLVSQRPPIRFTVVFATQQQGRTLIFRPITAYLGTPFDKNTWERKSDIRVIW